MVLLMDQNRSVLPLRSAKAYKLGRVVAEHSEPYRKTGQNQLFFAGPIEQMESEVN